MNPYITIDYFGDVNKDLTNKDNVIVAANRTDDRGRFPPQNRSSDGRQQPFWGQYIPPNSNLPVRIKQLKVEEQNKPTNSFFEVNYTDKTTKLKGPFDWLVHLDRQLISPMELLHVAAVKPHLLTQEFIKLLGGGTLQKYAHRVPWNDEDQSLGSIDSHRLYRFFELVATRSRAAGLEAPTIGGHVISNNQIRADRLSWITSSGVPAIIKPGDVLVLDKDLPDSHENVRVIGISQATATDIRLVLDPGPFGQALLKPHNRDPIRIELTTMGERVPGKININTIWDWQTFQALANPTSSNNYSATDIFNGSSLASPQDVFTAMIWQRTPLLRQGQLSATDQPFLGMAAGHYSGQVPFYGPGAMSYGTSGVNHTLLAGAQQGSASTFKRMMQVPFGGAPQHPFIANQLLTKLFNNVTTRSNVFAVWLTVGFFEVTQDTDANGNPVRPVKLGAEIGKAENRQIRHRMFAIVDRTGLTVPSQLGFAKSQSPSGAITAGTNQVTLLDRVDMKPIPLAGPIPIPNIGPNPPIGSIDPQSGRAFTQTMWWTLQPGDLVVVGEGTANQETVTVVGVDVQRNTFTADFRRPHQSRLETTVSLHVLPGNPGPVTRFDPRDPLYEEVVPYLSIIE